MGGVNTASNSLECRKTTPNYSVRVVLIVSCMQRRWSLIWLQHFLLSDLGLYCSWVMYSIVLSLSKSCNWFQLAGFNTVDWSYLWRLTQLRLYCILATRIDRRDGWMARAWPYINNIMEESFIIVLLNSYRPQLEEVLTDCRCWRARG